MAGRRVSARGTMSEAAKRHLKKARRREKHGLPPEQAEPSAKVFWILVTAALIVVAFVVWRAFGGG